MSEEKIRNFKRDLVPAPNLDRKLFDQMLSSFTKVVFEIGAGVGYFSLRFAEGNPDTLVLASEHTLNRYASFERRLQKHPHIKNLLPLHANAVSVLSHWLKPQSLDAVFINYPNPEPQNPAKRWFRMPFFAQILNCLKDEASLQLLTNEQFYFEEAKHFATQNWNLKIIDELKFNKQTHPLFMARTHFEKKYLERGETCFQLVLKKLSS